MPELAVAIAPDADLADPPSWIFEDISTSVRTADGVTINYGRRDEGSLVDTTNVTLRLDNRDGKFVRLNPLSPYFKRIRTGTPIRIIMAGGPKRLFLNGTGAHAQAADSPAFDLVGDLDLRVDFETGRPEPIVGGVYQTPAIAMRRTSTTFASWELITQRTALGPLHPEGLTFVWHLDGSGGTVNTAELTTYAPGGRNGRRAVRVTLELNVAGNHRISWYVAPTLADLQPGRLVHQETRAGTTVINPSNQPLTIGANQNGNQTTADITLRGWVYGLELRDGLNGTLVASPDFTAAPLGTGGFTDGQGNTWSLDEGAAVTDEWELFQGFVAEWPTRWDRSGRDSTVPISAVGQLRRLQRRDRQAAKSVVHRMVLANLRDG